METSTNFVKKSWVVLERVTVPSLLYLLLESKCRHCRWGHCTSAQWFWTILKTAWLILGTSDHTLGTVCLVYLAPRCHDSRHFSSFPHILLSFWTVPEKKRIWFWDDFSYKTWLNQYQSNFWTKLNKSFLQWNTVQQTSVRTNNLGHWKNVDLIQSLL